MSVPHISCAMLGNNYQNLNLEMNTYYYIQTLNTKKANEVLRVLKTNRTYQ